MSNPRAAHVVIPNYIVRANHVVVLCPSPGPLTFVRVPARCCFGSLTASVDVRGSSPKADCAKLTNGTSKTYCAYPNPPMRAQTKLPIYEDD